MYTVEYQYRFAYRPLFYEIDGRPTLTEPRPAISVTLHHGLFKLQAIALIDSGSTYSLFDYQIGKELGIDVRAGRLQRLSSLGGLVLGYAHLVELEVAEGWRFATEVLFSDDAIPRNLLGHHGFIEHVAVGLQGKTGQIYLRPEN
jgi:hypothetical protein